MHLEVREIRKQFHWKRALQGISLTIEPGQIVAMVGLNGAGKSTLLRCLAGLAAPDRGDLLYDGKSFSREDIATRRRFFFLPDEPQFFPGEPLVRNLSILLRLYEADRPGMEDRIVELFQELDLLGSAFRDPKGLSRGQRYKGMLAALVAIDPEIWLLDEPLASGMDPLGLAAFRKYARSAADRGRTVIYSTQILDTAERLSDRLLILHEGRVHAFGPAGALSELAGGNGGLDGLLDQLRDKTA